VTPRECIAYFADECRRGLAYRRDRLIGRQRRHYSAKRAALIERLGEQYRATLQVALDHGEEQ